MVGSGAVSATAETKLIIVVFWTLTTPGAAGPGCSVGGGTSVSDGGAIFGVGGIPNVLGLSCPGTVGNACVGSGKVAEGEDGLFSAGSELDLGFPGFTSTAEGCTTTSEFGLTEPVCSAASTDEVGAGVRVIGKVLQLPETDG